jgi:hypothetical protein
LFLKIAFSSIALIGIMAIMLCLLMTPRVEAFSLIGMQGRVVNAADNQGIPNVAVHNLDSGAFAPPTNTLGMFRIDVKSGTTAHYALELNNQQLTDYYVGAGADCINGFQVFKVALESYQREEVFPVTVAAGKSADAGLHMKVSLEPGSMKSWTGKAVQQHDWPQVFNYGRVVDGVYSLQGRTCPGLTLSVTVPAESLRNLEGKPDELMVIAYDARYANDDELLRPDKTEYGYDVGGYHRGWFRLDEPPASYLPHTEPKITKSDGGAVIQWLAETGRQYALMLPVEAQGTVTACYVKSENDPTAKYSKELLILDQPRPIMGIYDVEYSDGLNPNYIANEQPMHIHLCYPLDCPFVSNDGKSHDAFIKSDKQTDIPGEFIIHLYDFTLAQSVTYPPIKVVFPPHGEYSMELDQVKVGATTHLWIKGDLSRLAKPPRWDIGMDYHDDQFGDSAEMITPFPGAYRVNATLYEKSGAVVRLERWVNVEAGDVLGFSPDENCSTPIVRCAPENPQVQSTYMAQTTECVADPLPYGYSTGSMLGPQWLLTPPDTMHETPLKELHIVMYVRPLDGDTAPRSASAQPGGNGENRAVYLAASIGEVGPVSEWSGGTPVYPPPDVTEGSAIYSDIALTEVSHKVNLLRLQMEKAKPYKPLSEIEADLVQELMKVRDDFEKHNDICRLDGFSEGLGLDLFHLPSNHEVALKLDEFFNSRYYSLRYALHTDPLLPIEWTVNLRGMRIRNNNSLLIKMPMETQGLLINAQYDLLSGGNTPASITLTAQDGSIYKAYLDYSAVTQSARQPVKQR